MIPLRDQLDSGDPQIAREARLFAALAPLAPSEERKARVRAALAGKADRRQRAILVPVLAAIAVLVFGAVALALGDRVIDAFTRWRAPSAGEAQSPQPERGHEAPPPPSPSSNSSVTSEKASSEVPPGQPSRELPAARPVRHPARRASADAGAAPVAPTHPAAAVDTPASSDPEPAPRMMDPAAVIEQARGALANETLVDAVSALRRDHDAARAAMLIEFYLSRYPHGALAEEALALGIEAAIAAGRSDHAAVLARRYETTYPRGRYLDRAGHGSLPAR